MTKLVFAATVAVVLIIGSIIITIVDAVHGKPDSYMSM